MPIDERLSSAKTGHSRNSGFQDCFSLMRKQNGDPKATAF
jgi:hypothetical protein